MSSQKPSLEPFNEPKKPENDLNIVNQVEIELYTATNGQNKIDNGINLKQNKLMDLKHTEIIRSISSPVILNENEILILFDLF